jgi:hypothetical protein
MLAWGLESVPDIMAQAIMVDILIIPTRDTDILIPTTAIMAQATIRGIMDTGMVATTVAVAGITDMDITVKLEVG